MQNGLLGRKLSHSLSPEIHAFFGDSAYRLYRQEPDALGAFLKAEKFTGLNVTVPYKIDVVPYCRELSPIAQRLGSVNTILRREDGSLYGHNTDYAGFRYMLTACGAQVAQQKVLVLGSGGASKAVCAVLADAGAQVVVISRSGENNYENLSRHYDAYAVVNTTPVGMYPENGRAPVDLRPFSALKFVLDVIYNPTATALLLQAQDLGIATENGLSMLVAQGLESAKLFSRKDLAHISVPEVCRQIRQENIVLVGMPGCGKTTIGALLAQRLGKSFADTDEIIAKEQGLSPAQIITAQGEQAFRQIEAEVISRVGKQHNQVIVTGGGAVTAPENRNALRQNGKVIWIKRSICDLAKDGRPLSQGNLEELYAVRKALYDRFAHIAVENTGAVEDTVNRICEVVK